MNVRLVVLLAALAATLATVWWLEEQQGTDAAQDVVTPAVRPPASARPATANPAIHDTVMSVERTLRFEALGPDLFPPHSWQPPPPPPPEPPPPPPPTAPALPFQFMGRWQEGSEEVYFLAQGNQTLSLRRGESAGPWRLEGVGSGQLVFTYTPLNEQRILRLTP